MKSDKNIISHRGNLYGPQTANENSRESIIETIENGFCIEIDLWKLHVGQLWIGDKKPEYRIFHQELDKHRNKMYINCKNEEASEYCFDHKYRWFKDSGPIFTLNGDSWIHANLPESTSIEDVDYNKIIFLPEQSDRKDMNPLPFGLSDWHVCTDYPILYQFASESDYFISKQLIWQQGLLLDETYNEIQNRNSVIFKSQDPINLAKDRCIAVFSDIRASSYLIAISEVISEFFPNHFIFAPRNSRKPNQGCLHFTRMQISTFDYCSKHEITHDILEYFEFKLKHVDHLFDFPPLVEDNIQEEIILFHRILIVPTGLILVGYPNFPILEWRNKMREACKHCTWFGETHQQNIVHSTLMRFTSIPTANDLENIKQAIKHIQAFLPFQACVKPKLLRACNWTMGEEIARL